MRQMFVFALVTAALGLVLASSALSDATPVSGPADAVATGAARPVAVALLGTSTDAFAATVEQTTRTFSGTLNGSLGAGSYSGELTNTGFIDPPTVCFICGEAERFSVSGDLTFMFPNGSFTAEVQSGSQAALLLPSHFVELDFQLVLSVTGGSRRYQHASGDLTLAYRSLTQEGGPGCLPVDSGGTCGLPFDDGALSGTLVLGPPFLQ
jgi:hypothetical protein